MIMMISMHLKMNMRMSMSMSMGISMSVSMSMSMSMSMSTYVHTCMCIFICTYIFVYVLYRYAMKRVSFCVQTAECRYSKLRASDFPIQPPPGTTSRFQEAPGFFNLQGRRGSVARVALGLFRSPRGFWRRGWG